MQGDHLLTVQVYNYVAPNPNTETLFRHKESGACLAADTQRCVGSINGHGRQDHLFSFSAANMGSW